VLGGALALLVVLVLGGTIVLLRGGAAPSAWPGASPNASASAPTLGTPSATAAAPTAAPTSTTVPAGATPPPAGVRPPRIRFFVGPEGIECADPSHSGFIHVRWEVRNVTGVTISIDGPGIYEDYEGLTGEDDLPFSCSQSHRYLLTTVGGNGPPATREIVVEPIGVATSTPP